MHNVLLKWGTKQTRQSPPKFWKVPPLFEIHHPICSATARPRSPRNWQHNNQWESSTWNSWVFPLLLNHLHHIVHSTVQARSYLLTQKKHWHTPASVNTMNKVIICLEEAWNEAGRRTFKRRFHFVPVGEHV